jgi:enoyl-CoA hydratase/carnithine racemase
LSTPPALFDQHGNVATILLNRPKALNAYNKEMVELLIDHLYEFERDDSVKLVLIEGAGDRAYCAGGDIVHLGDITRENQLHHKVKTLKKPVVSIGDRIVMGGGMGLCCNSKYRVGTERSMFAMPETRIGYYPDAGATYFLSRLGDVGMYLALTGHRIKGFDGKHLDFVTHYVESRKLTDLREDLLICSSEDDLVNCLDFHEKDFHELSFKDNLLEISKCFSASSVLEIIERLQDSGSDFAAETLKTLSVMSPIALCISHRTQLLSRNLDFTECLRLECNISDKTFALGEFQEGVRALLIDKDNKPNWNPPTLEKVDPVVLNDVFSNTSIDWHPLP